MLLLAASFSCSASSERKSHGASAGQGPAERALIEGSTAVFRLSLDVSENPVGTEPARKLTRR
jgi:hypothetical protein